MKRSSLSQAPQKAGFTLVELLVAIVVLSVMLAGLATAMGYVSRLWLNGVGAMDNFTKARLVLNLLDRDIQMMVLRRDMAAFVDGTGKAIDSNGNTICAFYTNIQGYTTTASTNTRTLSLVQYLLSNPTTTPTLQRLNYGMNYSNTSPVVGTGSSVPTSLTQLTNPNVQTDTVFTGIIRFQIQFIDGTGAILTPPYIPTGSSSTTPGPFTYDFVNPGNTANPRTVVVSMLVLSNAAYTLATSSGSTTMGTLLGDFKNALPTTQPNQTFSQYWNSILNPTTGTLDTALPAPVRSGIQVFERHIPLPITPPSA